VILTLDEERNVTACLRSLAGFADVHVLDSGSRDQTRAIAESLGARVSVNPFRSFAQQRNWAHAQLPLAHDWVLHLDADERMTEALAAEITAAVLGDDGRLAGWWLAEQTMLHGRWLRYAGQYPRYQARLVHRARMHFVDHGHGQREAAELPFGRLHEPYVHEAFSHGLEHWLRKHASYARQEAELHAAAGADAIRDACSRDPVRRRRALKRLASRLPARPLLRWLHVMVAHGGWRDGRAGLDYARMMMTFEMMIGVMDTERRARVRQRGRAPGSEGAAAP
jgi:glycosyltransferase involved in cell wall biosynthesis